jgi:DNA polymerase
MTPEASIDFEWRSGADIGLGLPAYFGDDESVPLCLIYDLNDMLGRRLWIPGGPDPEELLDHVRRGGLVRGWNVMFEWHAWVTYCVPVLGWPPLTVAQCVCTMAEAQAMNLPASLDKCGTVLGLPQDKLKSKTGKGLIQDLCVPQEEPMVKPLTGYRSKGAHTRAVNDHARWALHGRWINDPAKLRLLYEYCDQDVVAEMAIKRKIRRLSATERSVWIKTQDINLRGVPIDVKGIRNITRVVQAETLRLDTELERVTAGVVTSGTQTGRLREWVNQQLPEDYALPDMTSETVEAKLLHAAQPEHAPAYPRHVLRALRIRAQVGQTSTAKLPKMLQVVASDGTLKNMHVYHGASTGRDASKGGVNLQNLKSPLVTDPALLRIAFEILGGGDHRAAHAYYGDELMDQAVSLVRGVICAPDGHEFTDADFSSVENRVSAWVAGQDDKLDLFRQGFDEYITFATSLYRVEYSQVTKAQRKFCKPAILGGMFGQGAIGLVGYAAAMGVYLDLERAQTLTDLYRSQYPKVQSLWYRCNEAMLQATCVPDVWVQAGKRLRLVVNNSRLVMELPSGRRIYWTNPRIELLRTPWGELRDTVTVEQTDSVTHQWRREKLIGSSCFQSAVQAIARDLLMHGVMNVESAGYRVVLRVHDELLSCNPVGFGSVDEFGALMCRAPAWADGLPLAFGGWRDKRFRKD